MLNNVILVGRVIELPTITNSTVKIAVQSTSKNPNIDMYDTYFFNITLTPNVMHNAIDYLKKGDMVGVKGHLETTTNYLINETEIKIICDRLTFLSQAHSADNKEEN